MGNWGIGLYQNDITCYIRDIYKEKLHKGKEDKEVTKEIIEENQELLKDIDDASLFWFALADTQWNMGRLEESVKKKALECIESENNIKILKIEGQEIFKKRKIVLDNLKQKLMSNQPTRKEISKYRLYRCEWNIGDTFAYKIEGKYIEEQFLEQYLIIQKVHEAVWYPGHIIPIVRVKITKDRHVPRNINELNSLEYVQISSVNYEDRFLPLNGLENIKNQIEKKSKYNYNVDEYGFLPVYMFKLIITSKSQMKGKVEFIGNYKDTILPNNEFIPYNYENVQSCKISNLEQYVLDSYIGHNLRQYQFYKNHIQIKK